MTSWTPGHATIALLIKRGHLERISGDAANGGYLIQQAQQRLAGSRTILQVDRVGAFELAYDGVRQAATALLIQQGLRPRLEGGHVAIAEAVQAQFGDAFHFFNAMRKIRNQLEYPRNPNDLDLSTADTEFALSYTESTIAAAEQLIAELGIWQP